MEQHSQMVPTFNCSPPFLSAHLKPLRIANINMPNPNVYFICITGCKIPEALSMNHLVGGLAQLNGNPIRSLTRNPLPLPSLRSNWVTSTTDKAAVVLRSQKTGIGLRGCRFPAAELLQGGLLITSLRSLHT